MIVYSLNNKNNPELPFYIGITNNIEQRFKQHQGNYQRHKPYVDNKDDFTIKKLIDTGTGECSVTLAEKIETNLIKFFNTVNYGSNKVYDVRAYMEEVFKIPSDENIYVNRHKPMSKKPHRHFKKVIELI